MKTSKAKRRYAIKRVGAVKFKEGALGGYWGQAKTSDNWQHTIIEIDTLASPYRQLNTIIHEHLHHLHPRWSEARVKEHADAQALMLWRQRAYLFQ